MQDEHKTEKAEAATGKPRRRSFDSLKIATALAAELTATGMSMAAFLVLEPSEKVDRIGARMKGLGFRQHEIPSAKSISAYFRAAPLEAGS